MKGGKIVFISILAFFIMLILPAIQAGCDINEKTKQMINHINYEETEFLFLYMCGYLEDVTIEYNETLDMNYYKGTIVNGFGISWMPSQLFIPIPFIMDKGSTCIIYDTTSEFSDLMIKQRFIELQNDHLLFSLRLVTSDS